MTNKEIAKNFQQLAQLMEFWDENPFKIKSYNSAYILLRKIDRPLETMSDAEITAIKGVGASIAKGIRELLTSGKLETMDALRSKTPAGVQAMLRISGYGPKKIKQLWQELGVESLGELLYACEENRLVSLKGFGDKTQADLKQKIQYLQQAEGKMLYANAERLANASANELRCATQHIYIKVSGELRRRCPIVELIQFVVIEKVDVLASLITEKTTMNVHKIEGNRVWVTTEQGVLMLFTTCQRNDLGSKLFKTTGSRAFIDAFLAQTKVSDFTNVSDEDDIFAKANLPYIPVELREDGKYLTEELPKLLDDVHIKGVIHTHTTYSDGANSLREMAEYAREEGFRYIVITDHSKAAFYANGLTEERVREQWREIDTLNGILAPFKIYKGIECDILNDGSLDYPDEFLKEFELVIASIHSNLRMDEEKATARLIKAIENPYVNILGHPTGRLLLAREGYPINHAKVIDACAEHKVAIELNANPNRLDIDYTWIPYALSKGVKISVNPDAHSCQGINDIRYGMYSARKGAVPFYMCVNTMQRDEFEKWMRKRKRLLAEANKLV
ncbi:MAG: hypothetical protein RI894_2698 [Bacteroidota bacterium]